MYRVLLFIGILVALAACQNKMVKKKRVDKKPSEQQSDLEIQYAKKRSDMVDHQIIARGVEDKRVTEAMKKVPRHRFVPVEYLDEAYNDYPVQIGEGQTISQPYIVAYMTEALKLRPSDKVLEIGTGSGYQAAVLAELCSEVYTIEIFGSLAKQAEKLLNELGYKNIHVKTGDGYLGWPENAPFDGIIVTCATGKVPQALLDQLKEGGRLVIPIREMAYQELKCFTKTNGQIVEERLLPVRFVPMLKEDGTSY